MRLRNVRGAREEMLVNPYVIQEPQQYKGHVAVQIFGNNNPIFIEVGMGKGQFITSLAALHPEINYIGIEKYSSVLIRSDPWPKDRHAKRRLTSSRFLGLYDQILADGGIVEFKTDNQPLFDFSLESVKESGWTLLMQTRDLHHSEFAEGNVMTEYEAKFSAMGNPIYKLEAVHDKKA